MKAFYLSMIELYNALQNESTLLSMCCRSLSRYPSLARLNNEERRGMLQLLGLWDVSLEEDCAPVYALALLSAGCLYTFKVMHNLDATRSRGDCLRQWFRQLV